jgi:hypothetical protein
MPGKAKSRAGLPNSHIGVSRLTIGASWEFPGGVLYGNTGAGENITNVRYTFTFGPFMNLIYV